MDSNTCMPFTFNAYIIIGVKPIGPLPKATSFLSTPFHYGSFFFLYLQAKLSFTIHKSKKISSKINLNFCESLQNAANLRMSPIAGTHFTGHFVLFSIFFLLVTLL